MRNSLDCKLQSISASIEAVCRKTLREVNRNSAAKPGPKNFRQKYTSEKNCDAKLGAKLVLTKMVRSDQTRVPYTITRAAVA
jgi:hypothetical protein